MLKFDFESYMSRYIDKNKLNELLEQKEFYQKKLKQDKMTGWFNDKISKNVVEDIINTSQQIKADDSVLLVIAIGGSYMGSYALNKLFSSTFMNSNVLYIGNNLSSPELLEVINYIKDKNIYLNVISKSGNTLEINLVYKIILNELKKKYDSKSLSKRIIITTGDHNGYLYKEAQSKSYKLFDIPDNIGGRYSLISPVHLLPLATANINIEDLIKGYYDGINYFDDAYYYACCRKLLFEQKKYIENFSIYNPSLYYFTEWLKQLFGETEGKNGKGIFPVSTVNTRDLHSLGQFLQNGKDIIFETVIKIDSQEDIMLNDISLNEINNLISNCVSVAHYKGNTPSNVITLSDVTSYTMGEIMMFFMIAASLSGYLFDVDPFNQPGVEEYKKEIKEKMKNYLN